MGLLKEDEDVAAKKAAATEAGHEPLVLAKPTVISKDKVAAEVGQGPEVGRLRNRHTAASCATS